MTKALIFHTIFFRHAKKRDMELATARAQILQHMPQIVKQHISLSIWTPNLGQYCVMNHHRAETLRDSTGSEPPQTFKCTLGLQERFDPYGEYRRNLGDETAGTTSIFLCCFRLWVHAGDTLCLKKCYWRRCSSKKKARSSQKVKIYFSTKQKKGRKAKASALPRHEYQVLGCGRQKHSYAKLKQRSEVMLDAETRDEVDFEG